MAEKVIHRGWRSPQWTCHDRLVTEIFGAVADVYDAVRPGYPAGIASAIGEYHRSHNNGGPAWVVELGAGTGKGTEILLRLGAPLTCVEPDARMARVLAARFPGVHIEVMNFEGWTLWAPVPLIACALSWHWLDAATRAQRVHAALAPGGTLAVFGHRYDYGDAAQREAVDAAFAGVMPGASGHEAQASEIAACGLFVDVETRLSAHELLMSTPDYMDLVRTFSPVRALAAADREALLAALAEAVGESVLLDLRTILVLASKAR